MYRMLLFLVTGLWMVTGWAAEVIQFSADTYQKGPRGEEFGRIYAGNNQTRSEMTRKDRKLILILDTKNQVSRLIDPANKSYMEQRGNMPPPDTGKRGGEVNPCRGIQGAQCKRLGEEKVAGRLAVKWDMTTQQQDETIQSTLWIDTERDTILRQTTSTGRTLEIQMVGPEKLGGRSVEKWKVSFSQSGGSVQESYRWYDPQLNLDIREELPSGYIRELRNIKVGEQDPGLFRVPAGFKKVTPQQKQQQKR